LLEDWKTRWYSRRHDDGVESMKAGWATILFSLVSATSAPAQDKPINIALSPASTTPPAFLLENFPKVGCANIAIVSDESKADYILEAHEGDFEGPNGSEGPHPPRRPRPRARYTLTQKGKLVFATTPVKEKSAVKDVCRYLQHGLSQ
jgi:hypothetical protein